MMNWECLLLLMVKYFCSNKLEGVGGWIFILLICMTRLPKEFYFKGDIKDSEGDFVDSVYLEIKISLVTKQQRRI